MRQILNIIVLITLITSCEDSYIPESHQSIIVEGWIEDGGFPVVILTQSLPVSSDYQNINDLGDYIIRWAKVTVIDGKDSVILTGMYDDRYFPPYIYTTGKMRGQAGHTYKLDVEYQKWHATATTTIPTIPKAAEYKVEQCTNSDVLYRITMHFMDNPNEKNYYQIFTKVGDDTEQYYASYLGAIDDAVLKGTSEIPVYRPHLITMDRYTPYFNFNDIVYVKLAQIDKASFDFWSEYIKSQSLSNNMFLYSSSNVPSNIVNGKGYWCGYGSTLTRLVISDCMLSEQ